jgi:hypothetical protein
MKDENVVSTLRVLFTNYGTRSVPTTLNNCLMDYSIR